MPKLNHQAEELARAISQVVNIEMAKAKLEVIRIINDGLNEEKPPVSILHDLANWAGN